MANKSNTGVKKDSKKWKFNIIDGLVLAVVILAAVFLFLRITGPAQTEDPKEELVYEPYVIEYYCDNSYNWVTDTLQVGDRITDDSMRLNMGALLDYDLQPSVFWQTNDAGQMVRATRDDQRAVTLVTIIDAADNGNGVTTYDNLILSLGHTLVLRVGEGKYYMSVRSFTKLSESPYAGTEIPEYGHVDEET